jgi:hypothetical protein
MHKQVHRIRQLRDRTEYADKVGFIVADWRREWRQARSRFERQQNARDVAALAANARPWRNGPQPARRLVIGYAIREPNYAVVVHVPWRLRSAMPRDVGMGCVNPPRDVGDLLAYQGLIRWFTAPIAMSASPFERLTKRSVMISSTFSLG